MLGWRASLSGSRSQEFKCPPDLVVRNTMTTRIFVPKRTDKCPRCPLFHAVFALVNPDQYNSALVNFVTDFNLTSFETLTQATMGSFGLCQRVFSIFSDRCYQKFSIPALATYSGVMLVIKSQATLRFTGDAVTAVMVSPCI